MIGRRRAGLSRRIETLDGRLGSDDAIAGKQDPMAMLETLPHRLEQLAGNLDLREQILSSMPDGVILFDPAGSIAYFNPAIQSLLGKTMTLPKEVLAGSVGEFSTRQPAARTLRATVSQLPDGSRLVVIQDITESRRVDEMRKDFVANVSHELKTPVAGILASAETLDIAAAEDPAKAGGFARSLFKEAQRLSKLVEDLLDLARLETDEASSFEPVDLSGIIQQELGRASELAAAKRLSVHAEIERGVELPAVPESIAQAVRNLLINAVRYTERGGLKVSLAREADVAVFTVADTGVGIPAKDLPRIFERFYRVDRARSRDTGGTGLGLSIVKHVAEIHGGEVEAESELGNGSTFRLMFPVKRP